ncbi:unnamed protein product [Caenorhabditis sp. 36 PRJEB53466]|nr:unnamed protein product [Caenorhabditis sp. 36 PRJEB53466]
MAPKLRARSSSRSRTSEGSAARMPQTPAKLAVVATSTPSKSPARGRGRPKKPTTASAVKNERQASKSATPRKANSRAASRSRSRSRGRPAGSATAPASASSSSFSGLSSSYRRGAKQRNTIESTHEVADEDEEPVSTPRLRTRTARSLTQDPVARTPRSLQNTPQKTIPDRVSSDASGSSCALRGRLCGVATGVKNGIVRVAQRVQSVIVAAFALLLSLLALPFSYVRAGWKKVAPRDAKTERCLLVALFVVAVAAVIYANPRFVRSTKLYFTERFWPEVLVVHNDLMIVLQVLYRDFDRSIAMFKNAGVRIWKWVADGKTVDV